MENSQPMTPSTENFDSEASQKVNPETYLKSWIQKLEQADEEEKKWREEVKKIKAKRINAKSDVKYNIFFSNIEMSLPAMLNSTPRPDIRSRFDKPDPLSRAIAELLSKCVTYSMDKYDYFDYWQSAVMDMLETGRGLNRVIYEAKFNQVPRTEQVPIQPPMPLDQDIPGAPEEPEPQMDANAEAAIPPPMTAQAPVAPTPQQMVEQPVMDEMGQPVMDDVIAYECVKLQHVKWDDFRRGQANRWEDVPWIAFRHWMTKDDITAMFDAEIAERMAYQDYLCEDTDGRTDDKKQVIQQTEIWEIWDKNERKVIFLSKNYKYSVLKEEPDPLELEQFYPVPKPLYSVLQTDSLVPVPEYRVIKSLLEEADEISARIKATVKAIRARGAFDSSLKELKTVMEAGDNQMVALTQASEVLRTGKGFDQAIWMYPIEAQAKVLSILVEQRENNKQAIYEITGMSDILRGQSNPNETAAAQKIKAQYGGMRLSRKQKLIQEYIRDIIRLVAELQANRFQQETMAMITGMDFAKEEQVQQAMAIIGQKNAEAAMMGMPPIPTPPPPDFTWTDILDVLRNDLMLSYKIDIETDSTISEAMEEEKTEYSQLMQSVVQYITGVAPLVQSGILPFGAAKALLMAWIRKFNLGIEVEEAFDQMVPPMPPMMGGPGGPMPPGGPAPQQLPPPGPENG